MSTEFGYSLAFFTGIAGTFHCLGMCGGLASGYFAGHGWGGKLSPHIAYHTIRIMTYTVLGMAGAMIGRVLVQAGFLGKGQGILFMIAGILVMGIGLWLAGLLPWKRTGQCRNGCSHTCPRNFGEWGKTLPFLAGLVNGLVPCGLVFSVAVKAVATADPLRSGLLMFCFGLGTVPSMLFVSTAGALIGEKARGIFARVTGLLVVLLGGWTFYEGFVFYDIMRGLAN